MLNSPTIAPWKVQFRHWMCICARQSALDDALLSRIKPWTFGGIACWCDRNDRPDDADASTPVYAEPDQV